MCFSFEGRPQSRGGSLEDRTKSIGKLIALALVAGAMLIHVGTALLRLNTFFPTPKLLDFAGFYVGAFALRASVPAYRNVPEFVTMLEKEQGLSVIPELSGSPPLGLAILKPLTFLSFPQASWVWLAILSALVLTCTFMLLSIAGEEKRPAKVLGVFLLIMTFGPTFLNLTLGQNAIFLLVAVLLMGRALRSGGAGREVSALASWLVAFSAKIFPLLWIAPLPLLRRGRLFIIAAAVLLGTNLIVHAAYPEASGDHWGRFFVQRSSSFVGFKGVEDQSLLAAVDRLSRTQQFDIPGRAVDVMHTIRWSPPHDLPFSAVLAVAFALCAALGVVYLYVLRRHGKEHPEIMFYLFILFCLILVPHTDRYNHVLVLPGLAWLWARAGGYRMMVCIIYFLFGLSRLSHLWAIALPFPVAAVAVSSGLCAVMVTGGAIVRGLSKVEAQR